MRSFVDDLDVVDETAVDSGPVYPLAQWLNGDPKRAAAGGVAHTGGVILPVKYLEAGVRPAPAWTKTAVTFANGKSETVLASQTVALAVVRTRFRWRVQQNGGTTYLPRSGYVGGAGLRGSLQALCAVYGYAFPLVVAFTGRASQEFERLLLEFNHKVLDAAHRPGVGQAGPNGAQAQRLPRFAFYLKLGPGPHQKAGHGPAKGAEAIITPPRLHLPPEVTPDYLAAAYVGRERLVELQQHYHAAADWVQAWDQFPAGSRAAPTPTREDGAGE